LNHDLQDTTAALIKHLKEHSILGSDSIPLMKPIEQCLRDCFDKMKKLKIPESKNYFAMSLKMFFMSITEDELEFVCHNYIHNWINMELKRSNRLLSKYQVEDKLNYVQEKREKSMNKSMVNASASVNQSIARGDKSINRELSQSTIDQKMPRYMAPTIGKVNKEKHQDNSDRKELESHLRKSDKNYESMKNLGNRASATRATSSNSQSIINRFSTNKVPSTPERKIQAWKPTAVRDKSLDHSFAMIVQSQNESNMVSYKMDKNDKTSDSTTKSLTRGGEESLVNRLYKEDVNKLSAKQKFYEQEKLRRDTAACTFAPNTSAKKKTYGQSNQLAISLYTDENKTEIKSIVKKG